MSLPFRQRQMVDAIVLERPYGGWVYWHELRAMLPEVKSVKLTVRALVRKGILEEEWLYDRYLSPVNWRFRLTPDGWLA